MIWNSLTATAGITCVKPASEADLSTLPVGFPLSHLQLLRMTDGLTSGYGYVRVFGVGEQVRDQIRWNDFECWRFACPSKAEGLWFFAENAHGGQYAYEYDENGSLRERVVYVDQNMTPAWTLPNFEVFVQNAVVKHATKPTDPLFEPTLRRLGTIPPNKHVVPVPHPCLGGDLASENVMLIDARTAMIMNADLWAEINRVGDVDQHSRAETYVDEKGRTRFRIGRNLAR